MPLYEFYCSKCNNKEEKLISLSKRNNSFNCEKCGEKLIRLFSTPSFKFVGTGFYETDVKKKRDAIKEGKDMKKMREEKRKAGEG